MEPVLIIVGVALFAVVCWWFSSRNHLTRLANAVRQSFANMDVYLKQRYDLVPDLVESARRFMKHETEMLDRVLAIRQSILNGNHGPFDPNHAEMQKSLGQIMAYAENYPQLRSDTAFDTLMRSLNEIEAQIAASRAAYNSAVATYNNAVQSFPMSIVASSSGFTPKEMFEISYHERQKNPAWN